jgi:exoribonuclease R
MPARRVRILPSTAVLVPALDGVRRELDVPESFPADVLAEAVDAAARGPVLPPEVSADIEDARHLDLVTIDPAGSRDLDQAYTAARRGRGYRVWYAIADVNAFVSPGGALDRESRVRGVTLYQPDARAPLYPEALGQGAASLLAGEDRQALLWTIDLDADGMPAGTPRCRRAHVRSRRAMSYPEAQAMIDTGADGTDGALTLLREIGRQREQVEAARGGISLRLPTQEVVLEDGHADLRFDAPLPVEGWNAQISLLTGIVAAGIMLKGRVGILRTLPPPDTTSLEALRRSAHALAVDWPTTMTYPGFVRSLDPRTTVGAVLLQRAARTLRGAGYTSFQGDLPEHVQHAAVASTYAHVTAPLRRLADRFANEVVLALLEEKRPPGWVLDALPTLPDAMAAASQHERALERAIIDLVEALLLAPHVGERFDATVISVDDHDRATVQLTDPAVLGSLHGRGFEVGATLPVRLDEADPKRRLVRFSPA